MISGASTALLGRWLAAVVLAAGAGPAAIAADAGGSWGVKELMQELAQVKTAKARFTERKHIAILNAPLDSSGTLTWTAPGKLEKHTTAPRQESLVLDGDRLTLERQGKRRTFALQEHPVIWSFVESIRSTLAGDLATLTRFYEVGLEGTQRQWRLTLKPVEPAMQGVVSEIRIEGSRDRVGVIEIVETQGDRSVMTIAREAP